MNYQNVITEEKIREAVNRIVEKTNPQKIIIFGSYAVDDFDKYSDLDLLIVKETDLPSHRRGRKILKELRGLKLPVDIVVYTPKEIKEWKEEKHSFISKILTEGKVIYDREEEEINTTMV
ncbi:nucleotidyltransferase domain-containing protein [Halarsenatibacter silvermanii]|uniref:Nucleotidyltransferase domain-containing protein n=1 Tax=Halarsenatibacter silvermanii TaxID=321763 RepID=A0A1G9KUG4_9FIRM|nr:nucleotidyltransferase domain-containing protein [Halarsenatibacter silvermanii]SDL53143.1 Nucleotidyltransferase domain-containing protein [Halarsenatibacter silvermanii]